MKLNLSFIYTSIVETVDESNYIVDDGSAKFKVGLAPPHVAPSSSWCHHLLHHTLLSPEFLHCSQSSTYHPLFFSIFVFAWCNCSDFIIKEIFSVFRSESNFSPTEIEEQPILLSSQCIALTCREISFSLLESLKASRYFSSLYHLYYSSTF